MTLFPYAVEEMKEQLRQLILRKLPELPATELSLGFHWPPFNSINHLHMHAIAPVSKMGWLKKQMFKPGSMWYRLADVVMEDLRGKTEGTTAGATATAAEGPATATPST